MARPQRGQVEFPAEDAVERNAVQVLDRLVQQVPAVLEGDVELAERRRIAFHPYQPFHPHAAFDVEELPPRALCIVVRHRKHAREGDLDLAGRGILEPEDEHVLGLPARDERAAPPAPLQEAAVGKMGERLLKRSDADGKELGQLDLRRQPVARRQDPVLDGANERVDDLAITGKVRSRLGPRDVLGDPGEGGVVHGSGGIL